MLKNATLRQLKVFEAVARNLSFTRASEELYLTQPTVSIQLKQLTEIIGQPLFEQVGKRIFLTETGRELLKVCHDIFDSLSRFEMLVSDMNGIKAGRLRIAIITTAKYFVPRMLGLFCERYPGIDVSLKVTNRERVQQRIDENLDDLYVVGQPPDNGEVAFEPFMENPLIVLAHHSHPLAGEKNISPDRLGKEYFLMRESGSGIRLATEQFFKDRGLKIKVRMELGSNEAIKHSVAGKLGIAVLSAHTLAIDGHNEEFAMLDVEGFPIRRHWYMAYQKDKHLSVVALAFLKFMHEESKILGEKYLKGITGFPTSDYIKK
jgi:LysR family transcriptional regulator, low CO2-responsive transcriptional regulator